MFRFNIIGNHAASKNIGASDAAAVRRCTSVLSVNECLDTSSLSGMRVG